MQQNQSQIETTLSNIQAKLATAQELLLAAGGEVEELYVSLGAETQNPAENT